jgi:hypothetical protein
MEPARNLLPIYVAATLGVILTGKPARYATYLAAAPLVRAILDPPESGRLKRFVTFANEHRVPLLVVAFPHLVNTETSRRLIEPVMRFFQEQRIPLLDVSPMVERLKPRDRIVNQNDAHPSVLLNHLVADSLLVMLRTLALPAASR